MTGEEKKTILIFTDWYVPGFRAGGPVQSVYNLALMLSRHYTVKVVCRDRDLNGQEPYPGITTNQWTELSPGHLVMYLDEKGATRGAINKLVKINKDNIIYINGLYSLYFSFLPAFFCSIYQVRNCFISVRGMLHRTALSVKPVRKQIFLAFCRGFGLYRKCTLLSSGPEETAEIRRSLGRAEIKEVPNIPMIPPATAPAKRFRQAGNMVSFLYLGRIAPEKNPLAVAEAFTRFTKPCKITFCGTGLNREYMSRFTNAFDSLPAHIVHEHIPELPHQQIAGLMSSHDVLVLPSLGENFGHAIFEAFVHGLPVIIGNNTPWKELEGMKAGIIVDPEDRTAILNAAMRFNAMTGEEYAEWSRGAFGVAQRYFETNNFEGIYLKLFS